jgi:uncharacterized sulfatase
MQVPGFLPDTSGVRGDTDGGPAKTRIWENRVRFPELFQQAFGKRPDEELYAVKEDPYNLKNLAGDSKYAEIRSRLSERLNRYRTATGDPRATGKGDLLDAVMRKYPALGSNSDTAGR